MGSLMHLKFFKGPFLPAGHTPYPSLGPWIQDCCCLLFEGCEAFLLEPRCWDSGTQSSSLDARSTLMADDVRY